MLSPSFSASQPESPRVSLSDLAWLEGCWEGEGLGGKVSLCWLRSADSRLTGVFQLEQKDGLKFVELIMISEIDGVVASRLKHFNPDFSPWEDANENIEFPVIETGNGFALLEGKEYRLVNTDELHIRVLLGLPTGENTWETFVYRRKV